MDETVLELNNIFKRFGALTVSDGVSLTLRRGEIHALIGPNGAGKSTLIKQIAGEIAPDAGTIRFEGADITALDAAARARLGLARSFQVSSLAPEFTALQNVMLAVLAMSGKTYRFLEPALSDVSLTGPAMACLARTGLEDRARIRAADLSHGERRQLEIAIALALRPKAFLLDEPMAGIGPGGTKKLTELLDGVRLEAPILLIEHDMDAVFALADRISVLVYGKIIATGRVDDIRGDQHVRKAYLGEEAV
jgi:branched-chain amino acid transport system ATP-binding protein